MNKINLKSTDKSSRLDSMIFNLGLSESRAKASDLIKEGKVLVNSKTISKPSYLVKVDDEILIEENSKQWVSRGAIKLLFAINSFELDVVEKVVYDIGASTGGFTQVCLEKGAKLVCSIDVGTDQLHEKLKNDKRVFDISSTDIRAIRNLNIPTPDLLVVDLSFISLTVALPIIMLTVPSKTKMICLIKPQFELSKKSLNKNGVVKKDEYIEEAINKIKDFMKAIKWQVIGIKNSPIRGRSGNKEFLLYASKGK